MNRAAVPKAGRRTPGSRRPPRGAPRVLVIEDDRDSARISQANLALAGLDVRVATTVAEAIAACEARRFDVVLVDLQLPGSSGWEFVRHVNETGRYQDMRLAIYSVHEDLGTVHMAEELGVEYLSKSWGPEVLVALVMRMLRERDASHVQGSG